MSVSAVDSGTPDLLLRSEGPGQRETRSRHQDLPVGRLVEVTVVDKTAAGRYSVRLNGASHTAESTTPLQPGSTVLTLVTGVGDQLELRALSAGEDPALAQLLATLAARYRIALSAAGQRQILGQASAQPAPDPALRAGLYLEKLGSEVTPAALSALLAAQLPKPVGASSTNERSALSAAPLTTDGAQRGLPLSQLLEQALAAPDTLNAGAHSNSDAGSDDTQHRDRPHSREEKSAASADPLATCGVLAKGLLNLSDGGAVQYRYGTLPLMVGGKLMELDLALFQQRAPSSAASPKRLVLSVNTSHLGLVRIAAQSHESRLSISVETDSAQGVATLTAAMPAIRGQIQELGWQVESLRCEVSSQGSTAASHVIDHVLNGGSLDRAV